MKTVVFTFLIFCLCLQTSHGTTLTELENLKAKTSQTEAVSSIRANALRETAMAVGAQIGRNEQAKKLQKLLDSYSERLDNIYRFGPLFLKSGVLPPVIDESQNAVTQETPDVIRFADHIYKIEKPERFVTTIPSWRNYLYVGLNVISTENQIQPLLKPYTETERNIWKEAVRKGWEAGRDQANEIFNINLARLEREYEGMLRYKILYTKSMVTSPVVNSLFRATAGNGKEMSVNDRIYRITGKSKLNLNSKQWRVQVKN